MTHGTHNAIDDPRNEDILIYINGELFFRKEVPRPEDGVWAKYWYQSVHQSTGFKPYKSQEKLIPEHLKPLLNECVPIYKRLIEHSL